MQKQTLDPRALPIVRELHKYLKLSRKAGSNRRKKKYSTKAIEKQTDLVKLVNIILVERKGGERQCQSKQKRTA